MPLALVHGLVVSLFIIQVPVEIGRGTGILVKALRRVDHQRRQIVPFVGIADFHGEGGEFVEGLGLGLFRHPLLRLDALSERCLELADQIRHLSFGGLGEEALHVHLAHGVGHQAVHQVDGTFPARRNLLRTVDLMAVFEVFLDEIVGQQRRTAIDDLPAIDVLQVLDRSVHQDLAGLGHGFGLAEIHFFRLVITVVAKVCLPVETGELLHLLDGHLVVVLLRDTLLLHRIVGDSQVGFDGPDAVHLVKRLLLGVTGQHEEVLHVLLRGFAHHHGLRIVGEIVLAVAQRQAALSDGHDVVGRVLFIRSHIHAEEQIVVLTRTVMQQLFAASDLVDLFQMGPQRSGAIGIQPDGVHGHVVKVPDLLGNAPLFVVLRRDLLDHVGQGLEIVITEFREGAPPGILRRLRVEITPVSRRILCEVIARTDGGIHVIVIDAGGLGRFGTAGSDDQPRCSEQK